MLERAGGNGKTDGRGGLSEFFGIQREKKTGAKGIAAPEPIYDIADLVGRIDTAGEGREMGLFRGAVKACDGTCAGADACRR